MATVIESAEGYFKDVFGELNDVIPDNAVMVKEIGFNKSKKLGEQYTEPVVLTNEHGVTYALANEGVFDLNDSVAMTTKEAKLDAVQFVIRSQMSTNFVTRAVSEGAQAFGKSMGLVVRNMLNSMTHRLESSLIYGKQGIGKTTTSVNVSATKTKVTLSAASWAVGMFAGGENARINFYLGTALISSAANSIFKITAVDITNRGITVEGTSTGIAALDTAAQVSGASLDIFWYGSYGKEMEGIDSIVTKSTGNLFNIAVADYHLWRGNTYAVGGNLTFEKLTASINDAIGKGLRKNVHSYMSTYTWTKFMQDLAGDRSLDSSYSKSKLENGTEEVCVYSQNGALKIKAHTMIKAGEAFVLGMEEFKRIGSTDITFTNPGNGSKFFRELTDKDGFELKAYTEQALMCTSPAIQTKLTGIVN